MQLLVSAYQRCKEYFSFCHPGIIVQYFLLLSRNFKWGLAYIFQEILFLMFYLKSITPEMWKLSWFSSFLLDYRGRTVCFFYVLEIFSAKPWFWIYFLSSRMTGFTTFCTSAAYNWGHNPILEFDTPWLSQRSPWVVYTSRFSLKCTPYDRFGEGFFFVVVLGVK